MQTVKSTRLVFTEGSSDKEYNLQLVKEGNGYKVNFQYGRRNGTLQSGSKTEVPVNLDAAEKVYNKLFKEKTGKGYIIDGVSTSAPAVESVPAEKESLGFVPQLLNPITDEELNELIEDSTVVFQKKYDGERRLVFKDGISCHGGNRKGQKVSLPKQIVESLSNESDVELDGEIIGTTLYVFDVLKYNGKDCRNETYEKRLKKMGQLSVGENVVIIFTAKTKEEKTQLVAQLKADGAEGVVAKKINAKYSSSRPNSGGPALKCKFYKSATAKVSALTKGKRSVQVSVHENGSFIDVGAVTIPANHQIPQVGDLVEVRYLYAYKGGCLYQPTYLGVRTDLDDVDASIAQLEYKQE